MNHREAAEKLLEQMCYSGALTHAVLALVDRLDDLGLHSHLEEFVEIGEDEDDS